MKTKFTHFINALLLLFVASILPVYVQFTVSPTIISTTGVSGSTATGTQPVSVNWTFTGSNVGAAV